MTEPARSPRLVTAGRVGRTHTLDGGFRVNDPQQPLAKGTLVTIAGTERKVTAVRGSRDSPIVRLQGVSSREAALALKGELLLVEEVDFPLEDGEWLAADLIGCDVAGLGPVARIMDGPSCDVLELADGTLVPLIADAVLSVDLEARVVEVDRAFLGLDS